MRDVSIETGIQLQDQFSGVIQGIMSSVSLAISAIYDMQQAMSMDVNMSSQETARENISQTAAAFVSLNKTMEAPVASNTPVCFKEAGLKGSGRKPKVRVLCWNG